MWLPMVPDDDRAAAVEASRAFPAERSAHFWDASRLVGRAWSAHFLPARLNELRHAVRDVPYLVEMVEEISRDPAQAPPAWDCAFFYGRELAWTEPLPVPATWTKQFGFWMAGERGENGGTFWSDRSASALIESSWVREMELGMRRIDEIAD